MITLKKSSLGIPNIFSNTEQDIITSDRNNLTFSCKKIGEMINLQQCLLGEQGIIHARTGLNICCVNKGYFTNNEKIFLLFVIKNDIQHVILSEEFLDSHKAIHSSIKKQLKELNIPKSNWIYLNQSIIYREFQELIIPTIDDYLPENQQKVIDEFKIYMAEEMSNGYAFEYEIY